MQFTKILLSILVLFTSFSAVTARLAVADIEVRENIVYSKAGDQELHLDILIPPDGGGLNPAVLVVHGGAWRSGNRRQLRGYAKSLAERGFVCFAIDYRLAPKYKFPAQIEDCREAVKWIRSHAEEFKVDAEKLGAIGYSAGGHLVTLLATTGEGPSEANGNAITRLQAVVAGGAPTEFRKLEDNGRWAKYWMGGDLEQVPDQFRNASATAFVEKSDPPIFFFNGTADRLVPLVWSRSCYDALKACGAKTELQTIKVAGHMQAARNKEALEKAYQFLESELLGRTSHVSSAAEPLPVSQ